MSSFFGYQLLDDNVVEPMETFQLVLSPGNGGPAAVPPVSDTATITITENDGELN